MSRATPIDLPMNRSVPVPPDDEFNRALVDCVHPSDYVNPVPSGRYNLVVIGAGTAGLVCAAGAAGLGAKVALIERHLMGGDCLNYGCVPSKGVIAAAKAMARVKDAERFGVKLAAEPEIDFPAVMERMRKLRSEISRHDSVHRFTELGVDVYLGEGSFVDSHTIRVADRELTFRKAVIATGARAAVPAIPGLPEVDYVTNETIFSLTELPRRLAVVGGGPIGAEMAQTFARFGSDVTLFEAGPRILSRDDPDAAAIVQNSLARDGVDLKLNASISGFSKTGTETTVSYAVGDVTAELRVDCVLISTGRAPNVEGLNLEGIGVDFDPREGVHVNEKLQTARKHIYAAGDICFRYKFTHTADFLARIVLRNALFPLGRSRTSGLVIPWCTYTDPELAHVGLSETAARERGIPVDTFVQPMDGVDRAILDGEIRGFVKIFLKKGTDKIMGATIVAPHAGDLISQITQAIVSGTRLGQIADVIHPYPTQADAIRKLGDQYNRTRLTPRVAALFRKWMNWTR